VSDYVESAWQTKGEPTTTAYGAHQSGFNEFGHRLPPKPVHNLHGAAGVPRDRIGLLPLDSLCHEFYRVTGTLPKELHVPGPKQADRFRSVNVHGIGTAFLDIRYGSETLHVL
jgi:hypothetical protein